MTVKMVAVGFWAGRQLRKVEAAPQSIWAAFHFRAWTHFFKSWWWRWVPSMVFSWTHTAVCFMETWENRFVLCYLWQEPNWFYIWPSLVGRFCVYTTQIEYTVFGCCICGHINSLLLQWWILSWFLQVVRLNFVIFSLSYPKRSNFSNCHFLRK